MGGDAGALSSTVGDDDGDGAEEEKGPPQVRLWPAWMAFRKPLFPRHTNALPLTLTFLLQGSAQMWRTSILREPPPRLPPDPYDEGVRDAQRHAVKVTTRPLLSLPLSLISLPHLPLRGQGDDSPTPLPPSLSDLSPSPAATRSR